MKKFEVYRNIRKRALIMGLPISLFALMMVSIMGSLLIIIFSFSFYVVIVMGVFNSLLYVGLTQFIRNPGLLQVKKIFPKSISNKKVSQLYYE